MEEKGGEGPAIGIDLGTSYSCVGVWKHNRVEIITNDQGNRTTPSWVAFNHSQCIVGDGAKDQVIRNPTNTIYDAKRLIGRRFTDETVQNNIKCKRWPFTVLSGKEDNPVIVVSYKGEQKQFSTQQISSMVLVKMKQTAEAFLGTKVKNVVITVPAYFNNSQRKATKDAGEIAELNVMRIINEPTAAAIAYGLEVRAVDCNVAERNILVFDLGGGTFDVSLVVVGKDSFEVKAVSGDTHLGGVDFDSRMVDHFVAEFKRMHNRDINGNPKALAKLRAQCERAKRILSSTTETMIEIDCLYQDIDFYSTIYREQFEKLNESLFKQCIEPIMTCLTDAKMDKGDVDDVVLVGGSTRIPKVQQLVQEFFEGKVLCQSLNPDEAVAYGAAIHAAILSGVRHDQHKLVDVTPLSLGIEIVFGQLNVVIPRNTRIPTTITRQYPTVEDYQTGMRNRVYEGENSIARENNLLGEFLIGGIPPAPKGVAKVTDTFEIDANSILTVTSEVDGTGFKSQIKITEYSGNLSKKEIDGMIKEAKKYEMGNMEHTKLGKSRCDVQMFVSKMSDTLGSCEKSITSDKKKKVEDAIEHTKQWLDWNIQLNHAGKFEDKLKELQDICKCLTDASLLKAGPSNLNKPKTNSLWGMLHSSNTDSDTSGISKKC